MVTVFGLTFRCRPKRDTYWSQLLESEACLSVA